MEDPKPKSLRQIKSEEGYKKALASGKIGRPKGSVAKFSDDGRDKMKRMIWKELRPLIKTLIRVAQGEIDVKRYNKKKKTWDIYTQPPDPQTGQFLISSLVGKTPIVNMEDGETQPIYNINITKIDNKPKQDEPISQ